MPKSRMDGAGLIGTPAISTAKVYSWCWWRPVAHHKTSVLSRLSCSLLRVFECAGAISTWMKFHPGPPGALRHSMKVNQQRLADTSRKPAYHRHRDAATNRSFQSAKSGPRWWRQWKLIKRFASTPVSELSGTSLRPSSRLTGIRTICFQLLAPEISSFPVVQLSIRTSLVVPCSLGSGSLGDGRVGAKARGSRTERRVATAARRLAAAYVRSSRRVERFASRHCQTKGPTDAVGGRSGVEVEAGRVDCSVRRCTPRPVHRYRWASPPAGMQRRDADIADWSSSIGPSRCRQGRELTGVGGGASWAVLTFQRSRKWLETRNININVQLWAYAWGLYARILHYSA